MLISTRTHTHTNIQTYFHSFMRILPTYATHKCFYSFCFSIICNMFSLEVPTFTAHHFPVCESNTSIPHFYTLVSAEDLHGSLPGELSYFPILILFRFPTTYVLFLKIYTSTSFILFSTRGRVALHHMHTHILH